MASERIDAKPIVKWAGGKSRLLGELLDRVPRRLKTYAEPFAGGAALFFALASERARGTRSFESAILADSNEELVACYRAVRDDVGSVIDALGAFRHDRELFYEVRARSTSGMTDVARAARFIFLNRTCFNGLWRVNSGGHFNVPFGKYKNPRILDREALHAASRALAGVDVRSSDFADVTGNLGRGDFVYLDPPYVPISRTASFTAYAKDGFTPGDQERLARELHAMKRRGVKAMLSNADTDVTRALYEGLTCHVVRAPRSISCDGATRGDAGELVVTTWERPGIRETRELREGLRTLSAAG
ncbi:MAG: DNA adenine methylase [Polyangiaceae bacterium]